MQMACLRWAVSMALDAKLGVDPGLVGETHLRLERTRHPVGHSQLVARHDRGRGHPCAFPQRHAEEVGVVGCPCLRWTVVVILVGGVHPGPVVALARDPWCREVVAFRTKTGGFQELHRSRVHVQMAEPWMTMILWVGGTMYRADAGLKRYEEILPGS